MKECSFQIASLPPSGTMEIAKAATELRAQGREIISMSMGEPDFPTPKHIVDTCIDALRCGKTHYVSSNGIPSLRQAISEKSIGENNINCCTPDNVLVAPTKHALFLATASLVSKDDEVLIPDPAWVSYAPQILFLGGKPVTVPYAPGYRLDPEAMAERITPKTKAIILNTPSNPLGAVASREELKAVADLAKDHDLFVITDEIYEKLIYEGEHVSVASMDDMFDRTITLNGFSKSYAMTGWRLGWAVAPGEVYTSMLKLQQHTMTCVPPFIQLAGVAALEGPTEPFREMLAEFAQRRKLILSLLGEIDGISCAPPGGAFYVFPGYEADIPSTEIAKRILHEGSTAITPGSAFGEAGEGHLRISYAASRENIRAGVEGIRKVFESL